MTAPLVVLALLSICAGWASLPKDGHAFGDYIHFSRGATMEQDWKRAEALAAADPTLRGDFRKATEAWAKASPAAPAAAEPAHAAAPAEAHAAAPAEGHGEAAAEGAHEGGHQSHAFEWVADVWIPATLIGLAGILLAFGVYRLKLIDPARVVAFLGPIHTLVYNKYYVDEFYRWMLDNVYYMVSKGIAWFDRHVVDGLMNGLAWAAQVTGGAVRQLQTGRVQAYALGMLGGVLILLGALKYLVIP